MSYIIAYLYSSLNIIITEHFTDIFYSSTIYGIDNNDGEDLIDNLR